MAKRKMLKFQLNEISAVDRPAQGEARAVIMKRYSDDEIAKENSDSNGAADMAANGGEVAKGDDMSDANEKVADLEKRLAAMEAQNQELTELAKMSDAEKAKMAGMTEEEKKKYMAKSEDERKADVAKALELDAVIYKSIDGTEYTKAEQKAADLAKRLDEQVTKAERADLEKRAGEILPNTAANVRADLLKSAEALGDDAVKALKAADAAMADVTKEKGTSHAAVQKNHNELVAKNKAAGMGDYEATVAAAAEMYKNQGEAA